MIRCLLEEVQARLRSGVAISSICQCVEELVLNSIDAEATCIAVRVDTEAGKVQVVDNGSGVSKDDLEKVGMRYYTSKCSVVEDLENIKFYGFRGEALASIGDIASTVQISSKMNKSAKTFAKLFQNGKPLDVYESEDSRPSPGTTVTVYNLFYNLPVRRKCMDCVLECERIRQRIEAISLMHPTVSFSMRNDASGEVVIQLPKKNGIVSRFSQIFGLAKSQKLREINHKQNEFEICGYISCEGHYNKNIQFLYVNSRLILKTRLHKLMNFLLRKQSASFTQKSSPRHKYECSSPSCSKMSSELNGIYILNIKCQYSVYDVCIEPAKTLIEFRNWDSLLSSVETAVKNFLTKENLIIEPSTEDCKEFSEENNFSISSAVVQTEKSGSSNVQECFQKACQDILESHKIVTLASKAVSRLSAVKSESVINNLDCNNNYSKEMSKVVTDANKCMPSVIQSTVQVLEEQNDLLNDESMSSEKRISISSESLIPKGILQDQGLKTSNVETSVPEEDDLLCRMRPLNVIEKEASEISEPKEDGNKCQNKKETTSLKMLYKSNKLLTTDALKSNQHKNYSELFNPTHTSILVQGCSVQLLVDTDKHREVQENDSGASKHAKHHQTAYSLKKCGHLQDVPALCPKAVTYGQKTDGVPLPDSERDGCFKLCSTDLATHVAQKKVGIKEEINQPSAGYKIGPISALDIFQEKLTKPQTLFDSVRGAASQTFKNDYANICAPFGSSVDTVHCRDTTDLEDKYKSAKSKKQNCSEPEKTFSIIKGSFGIQHVTLAHKKQNMRLSLCPKNKINGKLRRLPLSESLERFCRDYGKAISVPKSKLFSKCDSSNLLSDLQHPQIKPRKPGTAEQTCFKHDLWKESSKGRKNIHMSDLVMSESVPVHKGDNLLPVCPGNLYQSKDLNNMTSNLIVMSEDPDKCNLLEAKYTVVKAYPCTVAIGSPLSLSDYLQSRKMFSGSSGFQYSLSTKLSKMRDDLRGDLAVEEVKKPGERKEADPDLVPFEAVSTTSCQFSESSTLQECSDTSSVRNSTPVCSAIGTPSDCLGNKDFGSGVESSLTCSNVSVEFPSQDCSNTLLECISACSSTSISSTTAELPPVSEDKYLDSNAKAIDSADLQNCQLGSANNENSFPKKNSEENSQYKSDIPESLSSVWMQTFDVTLGKMVYINRLTGLSSYDAPRAEEMQVICKTDTTVAVNVVSQSAGMCKSGDSLQALFSEWKNPVFARCPEVAVNIGMGKSEGLAVKVHNILYPYRFTKEMIHTMKVLQQVDSKFIACLISTRSASDAASDGNLLVLVDQHAAHERIRLEQLIADSYETQSESEGRRKMRSSTVCPPLEITVTSEQKRLLQRYLIDMQDVGLDMTFPDSESSVVHICKVPQCFVEREANELRRGRQTIAKTVVEDLIREQLELLQNTGRARGTLPLTVLKVLASQACHGSIKFNDHLNLEECEQLMASLSSCQLPFQCAHGRPSMLPLADIDHLEMEEQNHHKPNLSRLKKLCKAWKIYGKQ